MENKEISKNQIFWLILCLFIIIIGVMTILWYSQTKELKRDYGCYNSHVQECLNCQERNLTYLLCSGFCVEPSSQDLDGKGCPVIHPSKNCFDLPKECNF